MSKDLSRTNKFSYSNYLRYFVRSTYPAKKSKTVQKKCLQVRHYAGFNYFGCLIGKLMHNFVLLFWIKEFNYLPPPSPPQHFPVTFSPLSSLPFLAKPPRILTLILIVCTCVCYRSKL